MIRSEYFPQTKLQSIVCYPIPADKLLGHDEYNNKKRGGKFQLNGLTRKSFQTYSSFDLCD